MSQTKLGQLAESEGFESVDAMLLERGLDSMVPAICIDPNCDYTTGMEPDQSRGWCENCRKRTVASALVLAGMI